ncbi:MAG: hypothetical protein ACP5UZ_04095 [Thermoplasmata archaeon]
MKAFENVSGDIGILASEARNIFEREGINIMGNVLLKCSWIELQITTDVKMN